MAKTDNIEFQKFSFSKGLTSMVKLDFRRMFTMPFFYILGGIALLMPILILVMTTLMDGTVSVNPQTGVETVIEGFDNVWQIIGQTSADSMSMSMDLVSMCNINMLYFMLAVLVCIFISADFRSGYSKNLFTVRSSKLDYVISKNLVWVASSMLIFILFFIGAVLGGAICSLPFDVGSAGVMGVVMCLLSKLVLTSLFVALFSLMAMIGKGKLWLSLLISLGSSMLLFTMVPMITPLDSTIINLILCLAGGIGFSIGMGAISNVVLKKTTLV